MKKPKLSILILLCISVFTACGKGAESQTGIQTGSYTVTDSEGNSVSLDAMPERVVALTSSLADLWLTAGGKLTGVSDDISERDLGINLEQVQIVGTTMTPNAESIIALAPDLVLASPDIPKHVDLAPLLQKADIPVFQASLDTFSEYLDVLRACTDLTGREDLYETHGLAQQAAIENLLNRVPEQEEPQPRVLFLRAYSSGVKAKATDHVVCDILNDAGTRNIAAIDGSLLEDLSLESIVGLNPEYIFVVTMGADTEAAIAAMEESLTSSPVWQEIQAIQDGHFYVLPKEPYHYKPNAKWSDAYEELLAIIYPESYSPS